MWTSYTCFRSLALCYRVEHGAALTVADINMRGRSADLDERLTQFIELGREIAKADPRARYRGSIPSNNVLLNPGYMAMRPTRLCIVNLNPQLGIGKSWVEETYEQIRRWGTSVDQSGYDEWYHYWVNEHFPKWPVFKWLKPVLAASGLDKTEISWLNVCKLPTVDAKGVSSAMCDIDFPWLAQQLDIIRPNVTLIGTKSAFKHILRQKKGSRYQAFFEKHQIELVQNRNRNKHAANIANANLIPELISRLTK